MRHPLSEARPAHRHRPGLALLVAAAIALLLPASAAVAQTHFTAQLFGQAEVPPVATDDYGDCVGILDAAETVFTLSCEHTVESPTAAHVHAGFGGQAGPVLLDLGDAASPIQAEWLLDEDDVVRLLAGGLYVNVHTAAKPDGLIRGQLLPNQPKEGKFLSLPLSGARVVPAATTSATGACFIEAAFEAEPFLPVRDIDLRVRCAHSADDATGARLVLGGAAGETGTESFDLGDGDSPIDADVALSGSFEANAFANGEVYVEILTASHPGGELRGQLDGCLTTPTTLCLNDGRFQVSLFWRTVGEVGDAVAVRETDDSGMFWFFRPSNLEMLVKVLDGCGVNGHYWVFAAATTDVGYDLKVTDTLADQTETYSNIRGNAAEPELDTGAFMTCP